MKSLNGLLFIVIGGLVIWIGATGRLPALAAALGMIRNAPATGPKKDAGASSDVTAGSSSTAPSLFSDVSGGSSSTAPGANQVIGLGPKGIAVWQSLQRPQSDVWHEALKSLGYE